MTDANAGKKPRSTTRRKAPALNRSVPILDRAAEGLSGPVAAWRTVRTMIGAPTGKPRPLARSVSAVLKAMADGTPVVLAATLPTTPTVDGYLGETAGSAKAMAVKKPIADKRARLQTFAIVGYSAKRKAVRVTPSLGIAWGQAGRAWLSLELLGRALAGGGRAYAPRPK
jgi:hypothetical protein